MSKLGDAIYVNTLNPMPVASTEMIANLKALQEMGAISRETIMEKSEIITDVDVEKKRLEGEDKRTQNLVESSNDKTKPSNEVGNDVVSF